MAHKDGHRKLTGWVPEAEAQALEEYAKRNERTLSAELRLAVRAYLDASTFLPSGDDTAPVGAREAA